MTLPNEWTKVVATISKEVMEQYEEIRALGPCNMLDRRCVQVEADRLGYRALACLTTTEFSLVFRHYFDLMGHYEIERL